LKEFRKAVTRGAEHEETWQKRLAAFRKAVPDVAATFERALGGDLPLGWDARLPAFTPKDGELATRDAGAKVLDVLGGAVPNLVGGSADLDVSTRTMLKGHGDFESPRTAPLTRPSFARGPESKGSVTAGPPPTQGMAGGVWGYAGRNIHFGIREHAMAAILTGMAHHGGVLPFGATFFTFSDYMRPSIRLAALSAARVIYVWTHDSIGLGEDGPTHQPVEQLPSLRAMPNLLLLRPADATETVEAWRIALKHKSGPVGLLLTRQKLPVLDRSALAPASGVARGAYVLADSKSPPEVILIATGSEVFVTLEAHKRLVRDGVRSRLVSMPSWELFEAQTRSYQESVFPPAVRARVSVEAAAPFGWERYVGLAGAIIGVNRFGASAPGDVVMRELGFTADHVVETAKAVLGRIQRSG
jgi:transketolase